MKYYLTTPIYYVNAAPHLGTAYSTFVADLIKRFKKMEGYDPVVLTTGSDEHSLKVERAAQIAGVNPLAYTTKMAAEFISQWAKLGIDYDHFIRTSDPKHHETVRWLFERCEKNGYIYKGSYTGAYCVSDEAYVNDVNPGDPCPNCGNPTETVTEENYFFKLSAFQKPLLELYEKNPAFVKPDHRRNEMIAFVEKGLNDLSITRTSMQVGDPRAGGRPPRLLRLVRCPDFLHERGEGRRSLARRSSPHRQGHPTLPCRLLAGLPYGGRFAAPKAGLRTRLDSARRK